MIFRKLAAGSNFEAGRTRKAAKHDRGFCFTPCCQVTFFQVSGGRDRASSLAETGWLRSTLPPLYKLETVRVRHSPLQRPIAEVDHPSARRLIPSAIQILTVNVGEEHTAVARVKSSSKRMDCLPSPEKLHVESCFR
jgi:hypothetical protein